LRLRHSDTFDLQRSVANDAALHEPLPITVRLQWRRAGRAKSSKMAHRWLAEETAVFAVELAGAFISDLEGRACGVETIHEHAPAGRLQPKLFLILKWTHRGEYPEVMVQR
jgi:hypothetical protein